MRKAAFKNLKSVFNKNFFTWSILLTTLFQMCLSQSVSFCYSSLKRYNKKNSIICAVLWNLRKFINLRYQPVSFLLIYSKIFEKIIFKTIYGFIDKNNLFNKNWSEFRTTLVYVSLLLLRTTFLKSSIPILH